MTITGQSANWQAAAACLSADLDLFFPVSTAGPAERQVARAKRICARCAVRAECLDFALAHEQFYGIWGGTTPEERRRHRRRSRRAAATAQKGNFAELGGNLRLSQRSMQARSSSVSTGLVT
jgi:WhiB family transcriptional regulator, redox-sensing transcriptional regulator